MVTGVLIIPPLWARQSNTDCKQANQNFCAPDNPTAFGRFAGFLAWYFNGQNGHGRVTEFVIMNEVNAAEWYNIGCGNGKSCDVNKWVTNYAQVYTAGYDQIRRELRQPLERSIRLAQAHVIMPVVAEGHRGRIVRRGHRRRRRHIPGEKGQEARRRRIDHCHIAGNRPR